MSSNPSWRRILLSLALVRIALALIMTVIAAVTDQIVSWDRALVGWSLFFETAALTAGAGLLLSGQHGDPRARDLGAFFLLLATSFTNWGLGYLGRVFPDSAQPLTILIRSLHVETFMPLFLWLFVRGFPRPALGAEDERLSVGIGLSGGVGAVLFTANLVAGFWLLEGQTPPRVLTPLLREQIAYYPLLMLLMLTALGWLATRVRRAPRRERRRARLFVAGLLLATVPIFTAAILWSFFPPFAALVDNNQTFYLVSFLLLHAFFVTLPFTTAYAVLKHRVLDVRLIARRAMQHLLARGTVLILVLLPLAAVALYLYAHRRESLDQILAGGRLLLLVGASALGLAAFNFRQPLLEAVDRRFFRERYDARRLLSELSARIRDSRDPLDMAFLVVSGVDRALHLTTASLLVEDPARGQLVDPQNRVSPLDVSSPLPALAAATRAPLDVDLARRHGPARRLPREARHYLVDEGFQLIVPLAASDGHLIGLLALGEKRSGLPFLKEDRALLQAVADAAAVGLELFQVRAQQGQAPATSWPSAASERLPNAQECLQCGRIHPPAAERCPECRRILTRAGVPFLLPGRFRFEERVGAGGMGVVYRATDLALGRSVAIKTLRSVSPEHALRLRREARTTASVSHPNLAFVYGLETWHGTPMLILEFLEGGTLSQRLRGGSPLEPGEVAELGLALSRGLAHLHREDVLHRDVKPSNIGYGRDGTPKLMDFGIARLASDRRHERSDGLKSSEGTLPPTSIWNDPSTLTTEHQIVGTLSYVPPEVLEGEDPSAAGDLWGLALVLYEALTGVKAYPPRDGSIELMERILSEPVADVRTLRSTTPPALAKVLTKALARDPAERYADALEMEADLRAVARELSGIRAGLHGLAA